MSLRPCLGVGRAGFTGCPPGLSRAVCRGLGLADGARSVSGTSSSLQNLRDRHSLAGPDCLGVFERAWQSLRFSSTATRPLSRSARGQGLQFRPRTRRHRSTRTRRHRATGRDFPGRPGRSCPPQSPRPCIGRSAGRRPSPCGWLPRQWPGRTARPTRSGPRHPRAEPWRAN